MRDAVLVLLILAGAVGWFSAYGPREAVDGSGLGPGDDRMGESPLVVSGSGAGIVTVTQSGEREAEDQRGREREEQAGEPDDRQEPGKEKPMSNLNELIWYAVGVATVLIGEATVLAVVAVWKIIHDNST